VIISGSGVKVCVFAIPKRSGLLQHAKSTATPRYCTTVGDIGCLWNIEFETYNQNMYAFSKMHLTCSNRHQGICVRLSGFTGRRHVRCLVYVFI
jgi:hypothetical protein